MITVENEITTTDANTVQQASFKKKEKETLHTYAHSN